MRFWQAFNRGLDRLSAFDWAMVIAGTMGFVSFEIAQQHEYPSTQPQPWWQSLASLVGLLFLLIGLLASLVKAFPKLKADNRAFVLALLAIGLGVPMIQLAVHDYVAYMATLAGVLSTALLALAVEGRSPQKPS